MIVQVTAVKLCVERHHRAFALWLSVLHLLLAFATPCRDQTREMGQAVVESARAKHALHARLLESKSVRQSIALLRRELTNHKAALM